MQARWRPSTCPPLGGIPTIAQQRALARGNLVDHPLVLLSVHAPPVGQRAKTEDEGVPKYELYGVRWTLLSLQRLIPRNASGFLPDVHPDPPAPRAVPAYNDFVARPPRTRQEEDDVAEGELTAGEAQPASGLTRS